MNKITYLFLLFFTNTLITFGQVYYVAPNGNDENSGSFEKPIESISRAQELASPGDTIYIRGGLYTLRPEQGINFHGPYSQSKKRLVKATTVTYASVNKLDKSGTKKAPIRYWAYPGETPVFDFSNIKPPNCRIVAFNILGNYIHIKGIEVKGVQVNTIKRTQSECFEISGSNITLENVSMHDGMAIGVYMLGGSNNLIVNCDAYNNWDYLSHDKKGGNVDGFGCHLPKGAVNNIFRGCRAWFNSDDGFDLINSGEPVLIENCWAFLNGYSKDLKSRGDGNGFKCGGYGSSPLKKIPVPVPRNTIQFCLAVKNKQSGFYANHHLNGSNWYHNTAYANKRNYNMLNRKAPEEGIYLTDVPGWGHHMKNNLGYKAKYKEITDIDFKECDLENNYFDLNLNIKDADFTNLDIAQLTYPRKQDGSLPSISFMHLKSNSQLIDKGVKTDFTFTGKAPDLGCFEHSESDENQTDYSLFMRADSLRYVNKISAKSGDLFKTIGHHGPAVENEWLALRMYFDKKAAIDLYSKNVPGLELKKHRWYPSVKAQKKGAGADYYKVGTTIGLGGIRLWDGKKTIPLNPVTKRAVKGDKENKCSYIEMLSENIPYKNGKVTIVVRVTVFSGKREAKIEAYTKGEKSVQFVTGINYHKGQKVFKDSDKIAVWGLHPEDVASEKVAVGAALIFNPDNFNDYIDDGNQKLLISKPTNKLITKVTAVNEKEKNFTSFASFSQYLKTIHY